MNAAKTSEKSARSLMNDQQALREADRAQAHRNELTNSRLHRLFVRMGRLSRSKDCTSIAPPHLRNALIVSLSLPFVRSPRAAKKFFWAARSRFSTTRCIICLLRSNCRLSAKFLKDPKRNRTLAFASISTPHLSVQSWLRRAISHHKGVPM
jgi:hypothetical protein